MGEFLDKQFPYGGDHGNQYQSGKVQDRELAKPDIDKHVFTRARTIARTPDEADNILISHIKFPNFPTLFFRLVLRFFCIDMYLICTFKS